jgi:hypothetical protein
VSLGSTFRTGRRLVRIIRPRGSPSAGAHHVGDQPLVLASPCLRTWSWFRHAPCCGARRVARRGSRGTWHGDEGARSRVRWCASRSVAIRTAAPASRSPAPACAWTLDRPRRSALDVPARAGRRALSEAAERMRVSSRTAEGSCRGRAGRTGGHYCRGLSFRNGTTRGACSTTRVAAPHSLRQSRPCAPSPGTTWPRAPRPSSGLGLPLERDARGELLDPPLQVRDAADVVVADPSVSPPAVLTTRTLGRASVWRLGGHHLPCTLVGRAASSRSFCGSVIRPFLDGAASALAALPCRRGLDRPRRRSLAASPRSRCRARAMARPGSAHAVGCLSTAASTTPFHRKRDSQFNESKSLMRLISSSAAFGSWR